MIDISKLPPTTEAALAHLGAVNTPSIDDLKILTLVEAWGQGYYGGLADAAPNEEVRKLLEKNGQEELAHAHRVSRAIESEYGENFPVPAPEENPYYVRPAGLVVTKRLLEGIARGEFGGDAFYEKFASVMKNSDAAALLRQNGKEEVRHGERLKAAIALMPA